MARRFRSLLDVEWIDFDPEPFRLRSEAEQVSLLG
jgi:hypothetical protein